MNSNASKNSWLRDEISGCECGEKSYRHVHCPCAKCNGRATDRSTELRHWREGTLIAMTTTANRADGNEDIELQDASIPDVFMQDSDDEFSDEENGNPDLDQHALDGPCRQPESHNHSSFNVNPLKKLVIKAVLNALTIKSNSGASIKTFEDVLDYGKTLLFTSLHDDIDIDCLTTLWPKNWNDVQSLLKEEGFEDAKEYFICYCGKEKEFTRDGKTIKRFVYSGKYGIMENKNDKCPQCGETNHRIKYMYLGLKSKVKNWFRSETMCKKMLAHWLEREHWLENSGGWQVKKELWDGKRWAELQWFWNPDSIWALPTCCVYCDIPICAAHLIQMRTAT